MAEFCKKCFIEKLLTSYERRDYDDGKLSIVMYEDEDFCEGCGQIAPVVNYTIREA